tara:strand:+ start:96 stop:803 length:708 start_codon:yes stop_codon:yes gene_type:complete
MKTNLVVVFFFGRRRRVSIAERNDPLVCLRKQVDCLLSYKHRLDQVTFVVNGEVPELYEEITKPLKSKLNLVTLNRQNLGISYGGFSAAVDAYIDDFDFFIFLEDDWVFCHDDFDELFFNKFKEKHNTSMVCAVSSTNDFPSHSLHGPHASVSIYGSSQNKLKQIISKYGLLPYSVDGYNSGQVFQTSLFFKIGNVVDVTDNFFVRFLDKRGEQCWGDKNKKELVKQLDFLNEAE